MIDHITLRLPVPNVLKLKIVTTNVVADNNIFNMWYFSYIYWPRYGPRIILAPAVQLPPMSMFTKFV